MILRCLPVSRVRYILGATCDGRQMLRTSPESPLNELDFVFIDNNEAVRAWLLSNPVQDDPLDLLVYSYRESNDIRPDSPPLRAHEYLGEDAVERWGAGVFPTRPGSSEVRKRSADYDPANMSADRRKRSRRGSVHGDEESDDHK
jgi:hypothetical protein